MTNLQTVYSEIPAHYEKVNRLITLGMDRHWRNSFIHTTIKLAPPGLWLDMCTGTGETAMLLAANKTPDTQVFAADYSFSMIKKFYEKPLSKSIPVSLANGFELPFETNTFSLITTSFATRNLHQSREHLQTAFKEFLRVLKPGGLYVSLESSRPKSTVVDYCFRKFVDFTVKPLGRWISGTTVGYAYLSRSIQEFYYPEQLADILRSSGFSTVHWKRLFPGAVAVHTAAKYLL